MINISPPFQLKLFRLFQNYHRGFVEIIKAVHFLLPLIRFNVRWNDEGCKSIKIINFLRRIVEYCGMKYFI